MFDVIDACSVTVVAKALILVSISLFVEIKMHIWHILVNKKQSGSI